MAFFTTLGSTLKKYFGSEHHEAPPSTAAREHYEAIKNRMTAGEKAREVMKDTPISKVQEDSGPAHKPDLAANHHKHSERGQ